jgi:drug/metabolite transporter (DMT)-like permease
MPTDPPPPAPRPADGPAVAAPAAGPRAGCTGSGEVGEDARARLSPLAANLVCMASMRAWAAGLPAADRLIPLIPPLPLTALRPSLAALVLVPVWWLLEGGRAVSRADWRRGLWVGGIGFGLSSLLLVVAQARTDAVTVAVISATMPVVGVALETFCDGRRVSAGLIAGLALSLAGGFLAYAGRFSGFGPGVGAVAMLGSVIAYVWGSRAAVRSLPGQSALGRVSVMVSVPGALAAAAVGAPSPDWAGLGWAEAGALATFSLSGLALANLLWILSVARIGIGVASLPSNASPFYVMLLGGGFIALQAIGAAIVLAGVLVAQRGGAGRTAEG